MPDTVTSSKKPGAAKAAKAAIVPQNTFYAGPNIPRLGLVRNTNYAVLTEAMQAAIIETPELRAFFIPISAYPEVAKDLAAGESGTSSGGFYYQAFNRVAAKYGGLRIGKLRGESE